MADTNTSPGEEALSLKVIEPVTIYDVLARYGVNARPTFIGSRPQGFGSWALSRVVETPKGTEAYGEPPEHAKAAGSIVAAFIGSEN